LLIASMLILFIRPLCRRNKELPQLLIVILPGLIVVLAHCMVDFAIRIPLYTLVLAAFTGFCISPEHEIRSRPAARFILPVTLSASLIILLIASLPITKTFRLDSPDYLSSATPADLVTAVRSSPSYWHAYYNLGRNAAHNPDLRKLAEKHIATASALDPHNYGLLLELGRLRLDMGMREEARQAYGEAKRLRSWLNIPEIKTLAPENDLSPEAEQR
jgi:hypothetical protein